MTDNPAGEFPPSRPSKTNYLLIVASVTVLAVLMGLAILGAGVFFVLQRNGPFAPARPRLPEESLAAKRQANTEAFGKATVESDASPEEIEALSLLLKSTARIKTAEQVEACFDIERLYQEVAAVTSNQKLVRAPGFLNGFREGFTKQFPDRSLLGNFVSAKVKRVKFLGGRDEAIVFSQHRTAEGVGVKMRWWVARSRGKWKIHDFEDLEMGVRSSANMAALLDVAGKQGLAPRQSEAMAAVGAATRLLTQRQYDQVEQQILPTLDVPLPKAIAGWRLAQLAIVQTSKDHWSETLDFIDRAAAINPDMPLLPMLRSQALNGLGRFEEAAVEARKYVAELGEDDHGSFLLGTALSGMGKKDEAADAFRQGLGAYADSVDNLVGLAGVLPADEMREVADRFAQFESPAARFRDVAGQLVAQDNASALAAVAARNRELAPGDLYNDYYEGELHWMRKEYDQAADSFRSVLPRMPQSERVECQTALRNSLLFAGKAAEAYQALPDGDDTFLSVCNHLVGNRDADGLDKVIALHAERRPDEPGLPYFRGEALYFQGKNAEAAAVFEPQLRKALPEPYRQPCLREYLRCMLELETPVEGYRAAPDAAVAFKFLADLLVDRWNGADKLEDLVAAHAERLPNDPWLPYYRGRLLMMRFRYDEAAELLAPLVESAQEEPLKADLAEACRAARAYAGKPQAAYAKSIDRDVGFERTAAYLAEELDVANLAALIATREADRADDPAVLYYKARLVDMACDYGAVAELLSPAMISAAEGEQRERMVSLLLGALYQTGGIKAACQAVRPDEAFGFLAGRLANIGDADALEELLAAYEPHSGGDARLSYYRGRVAQLRGRGEEAAESFSAWFKTAKTGEDDGEALDSYLEAMADARRPLEALRAAPDKPAAFGPLAGELAWRGDVDLLEGLIAARANDDDAGPRLGYWRGRALLMRGKEDEALAAYESVLRAAKSAEQPELVPAVWNEFAILGRPLEAYAMAGDAIEAFEYFGTSLLDNRDFGRLRQLVTVHEPNHPDDPCLAWFKAELLIAEGKFAEAGGLLETWLADESISYFYRFQMAHRRAMVKAGRALEAYRAAAKKRPAFTGLASTLYEAGDAASLAALVDAHRASDPHDPWLEFYAGQRLRLARQYDEADLAFATALAHPDAGAIRSSVVAARIASRFEAGKAVSAYEEIGPRLAALNALVDLCESKRDATQLAQLMAAHRERHPGDARLREWQLEVAAWNGDDEALLRSLEQLRAGLMRDSLGKLLGLHVRALIRLKRIDDARALLDSRQRFHRSPFYRAQVEATAGNVPAASAALYDCLRSGVEVQQLYRDPELGAALRTDAFAAFRERHPEAPSDDPAEKDGGD